MLRKLYTNDSQSSMGRQVGIEPTFPPPSFIRPNGGNRPMIPRSEPLSTPDTPREKPLPPVPHQRGKSTRRPRPRHQWLAQTSAACAQSLVSDMTLTINRFLVIQAGCRVQEIPDTRVIPHLERDIDNSLTFFYWSKVLSIMTAHNFDSVFILRLDLMHLRSRASFAWVTILAEAHTSIGCMEDINYLDLMAMYDSMNSTDHLVKHDVHQVPPGFSGGFSRILTQLQILVGNYESQPVTILTCLYRLQGCDKEINLPTLYYDSEKVSELALAWTSWL